MDVVEDCINSLTHNKTQVTKKGEKKETKGVLSYVATVGPLDFRTPNSGPANVVSRSPRRPSIVVDADMEFRSSLLSSVIIPAPLLPYRFPGRTAGRASSSTIQPEQGNPRQSYNTCLHKIACTHPVHTTWVLAILVSLSPACQSFSALVM